MLNQHDSWPESALVPNSVIRINFMLRSSSSTQITNIMKYKYTINNRELVQFTFSRAIKADKKRKLKLKITNAQNVSLIFENFLRSKAGNRFVRTTYTALPSRLLIFSRLSSTQPGIPKKKYEVLRNSCMMLNFFYQFAYGMERN